MPLVPLLKLNLPTLSCDSVTSLLRHSPRVAVSKLSEPLFLSLSNSDPM